MHEYFLLHPTELRHKWRELRKSLASSLTDEQHFKLVIDWWKSAPLSKRVIDYTDCATWSDPWELIENKNFDTNTISLCMFYTLLYSDDRRWTADRLKLAVVINRKCSTEQLVCVVDNKWILGLRYGILSNFENESDLEYCQMYNYNSSLRQIEEAHSWMENNYSC